MTEFQRRGAPVAAAALLAVLTAFATPATRAASPPEGDPVVQELRDGDHIQDTAVPVGSRRDKTPKRPRYEAADIGGDAIHLAPFWMPVIHPRTHSIKYVGVTLEFHPAGGKVNDACYVFPWVTESLVSYYNLYPLDAVPEAGNARLDAALLDAANAAAGAPLFDRAHVVPIDGTLHRLTDETRMLSMVCD